MFPAHPGLCTRRHLPACAGKGERERESLSINLQVKYEIGLISVFLE